MSSVIEIYIQSDINVKLVNHLVIYYLKQLNTKTQLNVKKIETTSLHKLVQGLRINDSRNLCKSSKFIIF